MRKPQTSQTKKAIALSSTSAFIAGLCCFSPVVIVLLGLGSAAFAGSLADTLYGDYKWYFRSAGILLIASAIYYWYVTESQGCTLDQKKRLRQKYLNLFLISTFTFIIFYIIWLYGIVELIGIRLNIWETPFWFGS